MKKNVTILGGGNLGSALAKGLASTDYRTTVTRRNVEAIRHLEDRDISVTDDNIAALQNADFIILCVQPAQVDALIDEIEPKLDARKHIIISTITGLEPTKVTSKLEGDFPFIRVMPNTAASINESMTCIEKTSYKEAEIKTEALFNTIGRTLFIDGSLMQAATVLGACGTAFFLRYIRAASQGGIEVGFHAEEAQLIAAQTALGAASLLVESGAHPEHEIDKVTTPLGCTIAGLNEMEHNGFSSALISGIKKSYDRIEDI